MKVSAHYAVTHFEDLSSAVDRGEAVEILRPGKAALHLVAASAGAPPEWRMPERPRSELLGSLAGRVQLGDDWDSAETNKEIQEMFEGSVIFPETQRS